MPRSIWNGTITFGAAQVPIKLYTATESKSVHFHRVHLKDGARIERRRICPKDGEEVPADDIVKGYEVGDEEYVVLTKDEVKAAAGDRGKVIHLQEFVEAEAIDPVFYERTYYLGCREDKRVYGVLLAALKRTGRAGIGRFSFRNREYLVAVRALEKVIALHTLRFHDEVVHGDDLEVPGGRKPASRELKMASSLVETLGEKFDANDYEDTHRESVLELIKRKAAGEEIDLTENLEPPQGDDLAAALEASLAGAES